MLTVDCGLGNRDVVLIDGDTLQVDPVGTYASVRVDGAFIVMTVPTGEEYRRLKATSRVRMRPGVLRALRRIGLAG